MTVVAAVVEVDQNGKEGHNHGVCEFLQLPMAGDRIVLPSGSGRLTIVRVLFIEHNPGWPGDTQPTPTAAVYVEFLHNTD